MSKVVKMIETESFKKAMKDEFYKKTESLHIYNIEFLMENDNDAIKLQLNNLINTYGPSRVVNALSTLVNRKKVA